MNSHEELKRAKKIQDEAKRETKDFNKKASLFKEAAKIREKTGTERDAKFDYANYHYATGRIELDRHKFTEAIKQYGKACALFCELGMKTQAFYSASSKVYVYIREKESTNSELPANGFFLEAEAFLKDYGDFSQKAYYISNKIYYLRFNSVLYERRGDVETANRYEEDLFQYLESVESLYKKAAINKILKMIRFHKHRYWNKKAKLLEGTTRNFEEIAKCYKKSAEILKDCDENLMFDEYVNYYKSLALANRRNYQGFVSNIQKAIEFAERRKDAAQIFYIQGLREDHLGFFSPDLDEVIQHLELAKEYYYKAGAKEAGKDMEFKLLYFKCQHCIGRAQFKQALSCLEKAIRMAREIRFPNIIYSFKLLIAERERCQGLHLFSRGKFRDSSSKIDKWLKLSESIKDTKKFQYFSVFRDLCSIMAKREFSGSDLLKIEEYLANIRGKRLGLSVYRLASLIYSYISLWLNQIREKQILEPIRIEIIGKIGGEEVIEELKQKLEVQRSLKEREWLHRLPRIFEERFDKNLYFLADVLEEFKHSAIREFYILLEKYLEIIVEFNAKAVWEHNWMENIGTEQKEFEVFTLGDFVESLDKLTTSGHSYLPAINDETWSLLRKHVSIRNNLSHEFAFKSETATDVLLDEITKIMYHFIQRFPLCIRIGRERRESWYESEILWSSLPRRVILYSKKELVKGEIYYIEPHKIFIDSPRELCPKVIITATCLKNLLGKKEYGNEMIYVSSARS